MPSSRAPRSLVSVVLAAVVLLAMFFVANATPSTATAGCPICFGIVTTYDPDGTAGPQPAVTRYYKNLTVDTPWALDVDGSKPAAPFVGILQPLITIVPGYEIGVSVLAVNPDRPTVTITRLGNTPPTMPLRVDLVTGNLNDDTAKKTSIGYDTLDSSAPAKFRAVLDLTDRDHNPATTQALGALTLTGAAKSLTLVEEEFTGNAGGTRTNDSVRRMTFSGDGTTTHVPGTIGLDLTSSTTVTHALLTHDSRTNLAFDIASPGGLPRTTGTLAELPTSVDLTLTDVDLDHDGTLDKQVDYVANATTAAADLNIQTAGQTTNVAITDLPATVHLGAALGDTKTNVTYHSSSRATKAVVTATKADSTFSATVDNLPTNIDELSSTTTATGGTIVFSSDARATDATLTADGGGKHAKITVTGVPKALTVLYSSTGGEGHYHYSTSGDLATHAQLDYTDEQGQHFVLDADQIPSVLNVDYAATSSGNDVNGDSALSFTYHASSPIPHAELHASNLVDLIDRAKQMDVVLDGIPTDFGLTVAKHQTSVQTLHEPIPAPEACTHEPDPQNDKRCPQYDGDDPIVKYKTVQSSTHDVNVSATTPGPGRLTHGEIEITSGPNDTLDQTNEIGRPEDGILYEDVADRYVVSGRISEFDDLVAQTHTVQTVTTTPDWDGNTSVADATPTDMTHAELDTAAPTHFLELKIDKQPQDGSAPVDRTDARLASLPTHIALDTGTADGVDQTTWNASSSVPGYNTAIIDGQHRPGLSIQHFTVDGGNIDEGDSTASIDPMPKNFTACQDGSSDTCTQGLFDANLAKAHAGPSADQIQQACDQYGTPACLTWFWFYRTFSCFGSESCSNPRFNAEPGDANNGSVRLQADEPITLFFAKGNYVQNAAPFTTLQFQNLTRFVLQAHDSGEYDCGSTFGNCRFGTIDLDTDGHSVAGSIEQASGSGAYFNFPDGFTADHLVWDFMQTGSISGRHATLGGLTCPSGTKIQTGSDDLTGRICNGDLT